MTKLPLDKLLPHPLNSNEMGKDTLAKLKRHIRRSGRYPPLIVRPHEGAYQILDGHHRAKALRALGQDQAQCVVWEASDDEALILLATLNRLEGVDPPHKRAKLLAEVERTMPTPQGLSELLGLLPETRARWEALRKYLDPPPAPAVVEALSDLPQAVHFFLTRDERAELDKALRGAGGSRESALMTLIRAGCAGRTA